MKGLVIIDDLPTFDQKTVALLETNERWASFLQTQFLSVVPVTSYPGLCLNPLGTMCTHRSGPRSLWCPPPPEDGAGVPGAGAAPRRLPQAPSRSHTRRAGSVGSPQAQRPQGPMRVNV